MLNSPRKERQGSAEVFYVALAELPESFEHVAEWAEVLVNDHPLSLGLRGCIDLSQVSTPTPPGVEYIRQFVTAIRPVLEAVYSARCALLVSSEPLLWRARLIETMTSGSRVCFRAFTNKAAALAWLDADQSEHRALVGPA